MLYNINNINNYNFHMYICIYIYIQKACIARFNELHAHVLHEWESHSCQWWTIYCHPLPCLPDIAPLYCLWCVVLKPSITWDIKHFVPAIKLDFLFCQNFDYISDFTRGTKTKTKTDFGSDFVLKTKSNFDFCKAHKPQKAKNQK